jgi:hypothetical protein
MTSAVTTTDDLVQDLRRLGLLNLAAGLDDVIARATRSRWPPRQIVQEI